MKSQISVPQAVQACYDLLGWLIPQLDNFPRQRRFTLGERLENGLLVILDALVEAAYSREQRPPLTRANRQLKINSYLWRLALESGGNEAPDTLPDSADCLWYITD